ncbi:MAG: PadR family transcriptional regulator [Terriglobales bacterium]|jgi:DNA-binding PadR family transcriptional regulator
MQRKQTAYVILGLLSIESNQSGYDIRKTIQGSVSFFWGESYGQIYPTLKRLAAEGLIVSRKSTSAARPQRQEYSITAAGHACLKEWLAVPYRDDPPRNEFLLKLFFGREAAPSVSIAHIRDFQDKLKHMLATLLEMETLGRARHSNNPHFPFWMLTHTYGVAQIRSALEWSESALAMLSSAKAATASKPRQQTAAPRRFRNLRV